LLEVYTAFHGLAGAAVRWILGYRLLCTDRRDIGIFRAFAAF